MRLRHCMACGTFMTKTFYFCPDCLKEFTCTGTHPLPEWAKYMIADHQSFYGKKAYTHEIPFSLLVGDDLERVENILEIEIEP